MIEVRGSFVASAVFHPCRADTFVEASDYAERYHMEAERSTIWKNATAPKVRRSMTFSVARISSFLKSYGEMRKGEQFVMGEVRARARERVRWSVSLGLLALALVFAPVPWRRLWAPAMGQTRSSDDIHRTSTTPQ